MCQPVEFVIHLNSELFFSEYLYKSTRSFGNHYLSSYTMFGVKIISQRNGRFFISFFLLCISCCCSVTKLCPTLCDSWTAASQDSLSFTIFQSLLKLISIESVMPPNHFLLCHSLLLLPSVFPSIRDFSNKSAVPIRRLKYWRFSSSISPSNEYSGLVSLKVDWLDLLAVQGTFRSLLQHHSLKASILWHSVFFTV